MTTTESRVRAALQLNAAEAPSANELARRLRSADVAGERPLPRSKSWGYLAGIVAVAGVAVAIGGVQLFNEDSNLSASENSAAAATLCRDVAPDIGANAVVVRAGTFRTPALENWFTSSPNGPEHSLAVYSGINPEAATTTMCIFTTDGYPVSGFAGVDGPGSVDGSRVLIQSSTVWTLAGVGTSQSLAHGFDELSSSQ